MTAVNKFLKDSAKVANQRKAAQELREKARQAASRAKDARKEAEKSRVDAIVELLVSRSNYEFNPLDMGIVKDRAFAYGVKEYCRVTENSDTLHRYRKACRDLEMAIATLHEIGQNAVANMVREISRDSDNSGKFRTTIGYMFNFDVNKLRANLERDITSREGWYDDAESLAHDTKLNALKDALKSIS